ncbi:MAG: hypothetical protein RBT63_10585 [Bdellovibrionales bacterium]|jgi:hypothetical protein|nr:hypothetical protein [Bdellovibrionales bacterium]
MTDKHGRRSARRNSHLAPDGSSHLNRLRHTHGLVELIDRHLMTALIESERPETVLDRVFEEYAFDLRRNGLVPVQFEEAVFEELRELTLEVIRKRTYGCLSIADYRASRK